MARALGLDLGTHHVKAALLRPARAGFHVERLESFPRSEWDLLGPAALLRKARLPTANVAVAFPSSKTFFRTLLLPDARSTRLEDAVRYACEDLTPHPVEDLVIAFRPLFEADSAKEAAAARAGQESGRMILAAAASKAHVAEYFHAFDSAGIEPAALIPDAAALLALLDFTPADSPAPKAILDVGVSSSTFVISQKETAPFFKTIRTGAASLDAALLAPSGQMENDHARFQVKQLAAEISRAFLLAPAAERPGKLWLCGGGALLKGFPQALSSTLGIDVQAADPLAWIGSRTVEPQAPIFAAAVGAAIASLTQRKASLSLLKGDFAPKPRIQKLAAPLATSLILAAASLIILLGSTLTSNARMGKELSQIRDNQNYLANRLLGTQATGGHLIVLLKSTLQGLQRNPAEGREPIRSALAALNDFARLIPSVESSQSPSIEIQSITVSQSGITAVIRAASRAQVDKLIAAANSSGLFVATAGEAVSSDSFINVTLQLKYKASS